MTRVLVIILFVWIFNQPSQAQIGVSRAIGVINLGSDSLYIPPIGKAKTSKCAIPGSCNGPCAIYTFTGAGNWNIEGNWEGGLMPPIVLSGCTQILINPAGNEECLLNIPIQIIPLGCSITIMSGKKFRIPGQLLRL